MDLPPFQASAAAWRAQAAEDRDPDGPLDLLLLEADTSFDAEGRQTTTWRYVYRVDDPKEAEGWTAVSWSWAPWREDRPDVKARVIAPDGTESWLDPSTLIEQSQATDDPKMYSDLRTLRGPFDNVVAGSIIEEVAVLHDHRARVPGGGSWSFYPDRSKSPARSVRVKVQAPVGVPLQLHTVGLGDEPRLRTHKGQQSWELALDERPAIPDWYGQLPVTGAPLARVDISTWGSWQAVAQAYDARLAEQISATGLEDLVQEVKAAPDRAEALRVATRGVQARIRYTGVELGENALVPYPPAKSVERGYGDCKDQASALIAVLRAAGIDADMALLRTGRGEDAADRLPGLARFDHAIVYVPGETPVWIDPTAVNYPVGTLGRNSVNRRALVIRPSTTELIETPAYGGLYREERTVDLRSGGVSNVQERTVLTGTANRSFIQEYTTASQEQIREWLEPYAKETFERAELASFSVDKSDPDAEQWTLTLEMTGANTAKAQPDGGMVRVFGRPAFNNLPELKEDVLASITSDVGSLADVGYLLRPSTSESQWTVLLPRGWEPEMLPPNVDEQIGGVHIWSQWTAEADQLHGSTGVDIAAGSLSLDELAQVDEVMDRTELSASWNIPVRPAALTALAQSPDTSLQLLRTEAGADNSLARATYLIALSRLGFSEYARKEAVALFEAHPDDAHASSALLRVVENAEGKIDLRAAPRAPLLDALLVRLAQDPDDEELYSPIQRLSAWNLWSDEPDEAIDARVSAALSTACERTTSTAAELNCWLARAERAIIVGEAADVATWKPPSSEPRGHAMHALAKGRSGDTDGALSGLRRLPTDTRAQAVDALKRLVFSTRSWTLDPVLLEKASEWATDPRDFAYYAEVARRTRPVDLRTVSDSPSAAARRMFVQTSDGVGSTPLEQIFSTAYPADRAAWSRRKLDGDVGVRQQPYVFGDYFGSLPTREERLDRDHWKVTLDGLKSPLYMWVERDERSYRVFADTDWVLPLARQAYTALADGDVKGAEAWRVALRGAMASPSSDAPAAALHNLLLMGLSEPADTERSRKVLAFVAHLGDPDQEAAVVSAFDALPDDVAMMACPALAQHFPVTEPALAQQVGKICKRVAPDPLQGGVMAYFALAAAHVPADVLTAETEQLVKLMAGHPMENLIRAASAAYALDFDTALDVLEGPARSEPTAAVLRAQTLVHVGRAQDALDAYETLLTQRKADALASLVLAHAALEVGDVAKAQRLWASAPALQIAEVRAYRNYVEGRLAELYGLNQVARQAYARVHTDDHPMSVGPDAKQRLANLPE